MANLSRNLHITALLLLFGISNAQELPDLELIKTLPINLDAASSEFDRKKNKLYFHDLTIKQGELKIVADEATATRLDFENARWEFSGSVVIENLGTTVRCDFAEILFREHQIRSAVMQGQPATFEQFKIDEERQTEGHANEMEYDADTGVIRMSDEAWVSDSANEVSGNRISYDLKRQYIIADADNDGQVRMKIVPPESSLPKIEDQIKQ
jgi:lipopolysaccharide export system protein LptA